MPVPAESDTTKQPSPASTGGAGASPATPPAPTSASEHHCPGDNTTVSPAPATVEHGAARSNGDASSSPTPSQTTQPPKQEPPNSPSGVEKPTKIFVGGLSWQTSEETLRESFEEYGEVTECSIMKDPITKRSRGFGFVTFKDAGCVEKVLNTHTEQPICIDEKMIDPKVAIPPKRLSAKVKRIFVGGLSSDSMEDDLKDHFERFGKVVEAQLMYDRTTQRHRGFGFVTFECEEPAEKVCSIQYHDIKGKKVEVKVAQTKEALAMQGRNKMMTSRNYPSYGFHSSPGYPQYYQPAAHPYHMEMVGYSASPVMYGGKHRGGKSNYSQYPSYGYNPSGYMGDHRMNGIYFAPTGYGSIPMPIMRGHMDSSMLQTSGMDYCNFADHFQGMALYPPPSPVSAYPPLTPITMATGMDIHSNSGGGAYSPPHGSLSPKSGTTSGASVNGYSSQVPVYAGGHTQASY